MRLSGYMNVPIEPAFLPLKNFTEYLMHHPHELIMYSKNKYIELNRAPINSTSNQKMHKSVKIRNTLTSFTHMLMQIRQSDISDRFSVTSTVHLVNVTIINW